MRNVILHFKSGNTMKLNFMSWREIRENIGKGSAHQWQLTDDGDFNLSEVEFVEYEELKKE